MARVVSEKLWTSEKLRYVQPPEWRSEYAYLLPISLADGTFECDPHRIWSQAYSYLREDWNAEKVGRLLDEFCRVGLLWRAEDENGRLWGFWVGSEKFLPSKERCKKKRYRVGRADLFEEYSGAAPGQHRPSPAKVLVKDLDLDLVKDLEKGKVLGSGSGFVAVPLTWDEIEAAQVKSENLPPLSESNSGSKKPKTSTKGKIKNEVPSWQHLTGDERRRALQQQAEEWTRKNGGARAQ
jgi:hypothetical protein